MADEILAYLADHPDAQDTLDGIVQWWLLERKIKYQKKLVGEALTELVARGFIHEWQDVDSRIHYRVNDQMTEAIQKRNRREDNK